MSARQFFSICASLCLGFLVSTVSAQTTWYVDDDGDSVNGCMSWVDACPDLQTALDLAFSGDQIWVADGTYYPWFESEPGVPRSATFQLPAGVEIYGGFDGTETTLEERAGLFDQTILSGDLGNDDVAVPCTQDSPDCDSYGGLCTDGFCIIKQNNGDNSYHVVTGSGTDATAVLDGFAIEGGNANGADPNRFGGGMYNDAGSPTVTNWTFTGNSAHAEGGGMYNDAGSPTVTNCTFRGNSAADGGGMYNDDSSHPTVTNCILWGDTPEEIYDDGTGMTTVTYSVVMDDDPDDGVVWPGMGNIDDDPLLVDPDGPDDIPRTKDDDLRLLPGSPCIDAADDTAVPPDTQDLDGDGDTSERTPLDLGGSPRFLDDPDTPDTGVADPPDIMAVVDMGAYEYFVDCNGNDIPDMCDLDCDGLGGDCNVPDCGLSSDDDGNGIPDECEPAIPTVSEWGLVAMTLLMLTGASLMLRRRGSP